MKLLESKEELTLNELLRIAYEYGNDGAQMPEDSDTVDKEFSEWLETAKPLFKKLTIPRVSNLHCECGSEYYHTYKCVNINCPNCVIKT